MPEELDLLLWDIDEMLDGDDFGPEPIALQLLTLDDILDAVCAEGRFPQVRTPEVTELMSAESARRWSNRRCRVRCKEKQPPTAA